MRILVVEDDRDLRDGLVLAMRDQGYAVDMAADGPSGLTKAMSWDYDLVILDLMLPGFDGQQLLQRLRRERKTPVLILSARDTLKDRIEGLDLGADDYLIKPFELTELQARVRALIRRSIGVANTLLTIGQLTVDTAARRVQLAGVEIVLTAREYRLLELMAMRRGQVVTRTMIYDHLFDEDHDSLSNLVDVYVSRLRTKLGKQWITTRRGEGYVLDDVATSPIDALNSSGMAES